MKKKTGLARVFQLKNQKKACQTKRKTTLPHKAKPTDGPPGGVWSLRLTGDSASPYVAIRE